MKIVNAITGKIGTYFVGPKCYLNENIRLGEVAICIGREEIRSSKPFIWIIGGAEQLIDYISLARQQGAMDEDTVNTLLTRLDESKTKTPKSAIERLASAADMEVSELSQLLEVAQVFVSAPVSGVQDFSDVKPKWLPKTVPYASIH